jgi:predicted RNA-binding Zn-ribbon protein involved in translation (DUF1610 family)
MIVDKKVADSAMYKLFCLVEQVKQDIKSGTLRCPKCGTRTIQRDGTDLHCWACGHVIYNAFPS